jgi:hypothetical protein
MTSLSLAFVHREKSFPPTAVLMGCWQARDSAADDRPGIYVDPSSGVKDGGPSAGDES